MTLSFGPFSDGPWSELLDRWSLDIILTPYYAVNPKDPKRINHTHWLQIYIEGIKQVPTTTSNWGWSSPHNLSIHGDFSMLQRWSQSHQELSVVLSETLASYWINGMLVASCKLEPGEAGTRGDGDFNKNIPSSKLEKACLPCYRTR